jgi:hypothetical protein
MIVKKKKKQRRLHDLLLIRFGPLVQGKSIVTKPDRTGRLTHL